MAYSFAPINYTGASLTLNNESHANGVIVSISKADGWTVTLPAATGSGDFYKVRVGASITSNTGIIAALGTDILQGAIALTTDASGVTVPTTATSDKISFNGGTQGGIEGSLVRFDDIASGKWVVTGFAISTGAEATPFSAT